jgi:predicted N-acyltransferase
MVLTAHVTNDIKEIGEAAWNALSAGQPFQSYNWYRFGERAMATAKPAYVVLSEGGQAVARASFWRIDNEPSAHGLLASFLKHWPFLICRSPLSAQTGMILPTPRDKALVEFAKLGRRLRRQEGCSLLLFDNLDAATVGAIPRAVRYSFGMPGTVLHVDGNSFEEYVASLPRKKQRDIGHNLRKIAEAGIIVTRHQSVDDLDEAENLYRMLEARKGAERNHWVRSMWTNMAMVNGTWIAARDAGGRLHACGTSLEDHGAQLETNMGHDETPYAYLAVLYESIRLGLEHGLHSFYWGATSYEMKRRMGFSTIENDSVAIAL